MCDVTDDRGLQIERLERDNRRLKDVLIVCERVLMTPHKSRKRPNGTSEGTALRAIAALKEYA